MTMNGYAIHDVLAWEALDSRGRPTVGCRVTLEGGGVGRVIVPSGASTGAHEARELRDGGSRYQGWGVEAAVRNVNSEIAATVRGVGFADQAELDGILEALDGEADLGRLGSNAVLATSLATLLATADSERTPLWKLLDDEPSGVPLIPLPMVNMFSGGAHAAHAVDIQDFLAVPVGAESMSQAIEWVSRIRAECALLLDAAGGWSALVADEGGLAGRTATNEDMLRMLTEAIERAGFAPGEDAAIAIDVAASQLVVGDRIKLAERDEPLTGAEWNDRLLDWAKRYPIVSIEDPLGEDDWTTWSSTTRDFPGIQVIGDDLFATNLERLDRGIQDGAANAVLVKVNQAGTVSRAVDVLRRAKSAGFATIVSARSGDTEDGWLSDLAVGWRAGQIKVGSTMRSERTAKWNRLLEIEATEETEFAGSNGLRQLSA